LLRGLKGKSVMYTSGKCDVAVPNHPVVGGMPLPPAIPVNIVGGIMP
jgi:hypothetical protein